MAPVPGSTVAAATRGSPGRPSWRSRCRGGGVEGGRVEGGLHPVAADGEALQPGGGVLAEDVERLRFPFHELDEVGGQGGTGRRAGRRQGERLGPGVGQLAVGEPAVLGHVGQHRVPAADDRPGIGAGVEPVGRLDLPRQGRRLRHRQPGRVDVEEGAGGGGEPVGPLAEVDLVEVALEELVLGGAPFELAGDERLVDLAVEGAGAGGEVGLGQLLGDGAAPLVAAPQVPPRRPGQRQGVDTGVAVEALVLGGQDGPPDRDGDVGQAQRPAVLLLEGGQQAPVGGHDPGGGGQVGEGTHGRRPPVGAPQHGGRRAIQGRLPQRRHGRHHHADRDAGDGGPPDGPAGPSAPPARHGLAVRGGRDRRRAYRAPVVGALVRRDA